MSVVFKNFPVLQTPNLVLRKLHSEDLNSLFQLYSDPSVSSSQERPPFEIIEEAAILLKQIKDTYKSTTGIRWGIEHRESGNIIGTIGIKSSVPVAAHGEIDIHFELVEQSRGKGFMAEALSSVVNFSLEVIQVHKISAAFFSDNRGIPHLLEKYMFLEEFKEMRYNPAMNSEVEYTIYSRINPNIH
jgi:[ribosomal protein S5]-alanine N-acetyltransferase